MKLFLHSLSYRLQSQAYFISFISVWEYLEKEFDFRGGATQEKSETLLSEQAGKHDKNLLGGDF